MVRVLGRINKDVPISLHGASILHAACRYGHTQLTQLLINKMPEILFSITNEAYNPLHVAVVHQHINIVKLLVENQSRSSSSRGSRRGEGGPARKQGYELSLVESLHLQQARFGEPAMTGHTALHFAVALDNRDILRILIKNRRRLKLSCESNKCGYTALHLAVFLNHTECSQLLLKSGANPNTTLSLPQCDLNNITTGILSEAVINKNLGLLQTIINYGGEDRDHSAIKLCIPSAEHRNFIVPLLAGLVRMDDGVKLNKQATRKIKTGIAGWANLQLTEIDPVWISKAIKCCKFLKAQKIETGKFFNYLTTINLSGNRLSWLPHELFQLNGVQILNVSSNQITELPDLQQEYNPDKEVYEWSCQNLTKLNISRNQLTILPLFIFHIPNLNHLDVSYNQLNSLSFDLWHAPKLYHMNVSHNRLKDIPTNWPGVLETHCVYEPEQHTTDQGDGEGNGEHGSGNGRRSRRKKLSSVHGVRISYSGTVTDDVDTSEPSSITRLQDCLNISNSTLPIEWSEGESREEMYEGLGILDLSNNLISDIPDNLPCLCPKLIRLDLSHNQIRNISIPRQFPPHLKDLTLSYNLIETLDCTTTMAKPLPCTNPIVLAETEAIYRDNITFCVHRQHSIMSGLSVLKLNNCQLREVNMYSSLTTTNASRQRKRQSTTDDGGINTSKLQNPEGLVCPLLTRLLLSHNFLNSVPDSVCDMISLNSLDLSHNDIIELPAKLGKLCNLWEFPLYGLKLISPPHNIIERGKTKDIIGFLWSLLQRYI